MPSGPAIIMIHVASTRVPFTSEAKEAIADIPEVVDEIERGLRECARHLRTHLNREKRRKKISRKFRIVREILPMIAEKSADIVDRDVPPLETVMTKIMGVVYVEKSFDWENGVCRGILDINNYTPKEKELVIYIEKPYPETELLKSSIEPAFDGEYLKWDIESLSSSKGESIEFEFDGGLEKEDVGGLEVYVEGVKETSLIGAETLPDDWGVELAEIEKE